MQETTIYSEYEINPDNKMMTRTPCKVSSMENGSNTTNVTHCSNMNVILQFPESAENHNNIINEVRLILLDIFQKNVREQFTPSNAFHSNTKETTHESNKN